jgi:hypothetical protein
MTASSPRSACLKAICVTSFALLASLPAFAGDSAVSILDKQTAAPGQPSDLTLANFFTEGWDDAWTHRATPDGAPDMSLLHVTTNFLEREERTDFYSQHDVSGAGTRSLDYLDSLIAYGLNRRIMFEALGAYQWNTARSGRERNGLGGAFVTRIQLIDVPGASYAFNFRVSAPNAGIKSPQTTYSPSLAGWQDLSRYGLSRVGLYYSITDNSYVGPPDSNNRRNALGYAVALAKTWTQPTEPLIGNFTTFVEFYGETPLDGAESGNTAIDVTPGIRFNLGHGNIFMAGVDLPVTTPHNFDSTYRLTYIINF